VEINQCLNQSVLRLILQKKSRPLILRKKRWPVEINLYPNQSILKLKLPLALKKKSKLQVIKICPATKDSPIKL